jgi:hypothetical protein
MWELYLITRLDNINTLGIFLFIFSAIALMVASGMFFIENNRKLSKLMLLIGSITIVIGTTILVFVPNTKEAMFILGVGKSIDYLKSNETAKQLPDKCINALNVWVDSFTEENKRKESD